MLPKAANLQKIRDGRRTYAITPSLPGGFIKPATIRKYADVADKYGATLKITSAQRIMIIGLKAEDVEKVWEELEITPALSYANCVRSVKMCPGVAFCKRGLADSIKLGMELDRRYHKLEMPSRVKIGVAGCPNSCAEVHIKDIGVFADDNGGWTVMVGGSCGRNPRLADKLVENLTEEDVLILVDVIFEYYKKNADIERLGQLIDRIGFDKFKADVLALYIAAKSSQKVVAPTDIPAQVAAAAAPQILTPAFPLGGGNSQTEEAVQGGKITTASIIGDIIRQYPQTITVFRSHGMGCLGCPSATGESLEKAAGIHGLDVNTLLVDLNKVV